MRYPPHRLRQRSWCALGAVRITLNSFLSMRRELRVERVAISIAFAVPLKAHQYCSLASCSFRPKGRRPRYITTFRVSEHWKGSPGGSVAVYYVERRGDYIGATEFRHGERYIVFHHLVRALQLRNGVRVCLMIIHRDAAKQNLRLALRKGTHIRPPRQQSGYAVDKHGPQVKDIVGLQPNGQPA